MDSALQVRLRSQLNRILSSKEFSGSQRIQAFLRFVVEEEIEGRGHQLKETVIASTVYGRPTDYDPRIDSVVRVDASKIRQRLDRYYENDGAKDPLLITLPKGSYRPAIEQRSPQIRTPNINWRVGFFILLFIILASGALIWWKRAETSAPDPTRMTMHRLSEQDFFSSSASVSQDGKLIVYSSDKGGSNTLNLWSQFMDGTGLSQLTRSDFHHYEPTISADGKTIAFRIGKPGGSLAQMPVSGNGQQTLIFNSAGGRNPKFSPRGKSLLYWVPSDEQTMDQGRVYVSDLTSASAQGPVRLFGDFAHAAYPIWSDEANKVLVLGTWQSNIAEKEFDAWVIELKGSHSSSTPRKTGLFPALRKANLHPFKTSRSLIEVAAWHSGWLYLTIPMGQTRDLFRIRLQSGRDEVEGSFERVTLGAGQVRGVQILDGNEIVFSRQESNSNLYSISVPDNPQQSSDLLQHTEQADLIVRPAIHYSGTKAVWEKISSVGPDQPWYHDLALKQGRHLSTDLELLRTHLLLSPNGRNVAFRVDHPSQQPIYMQDVDGGTSRMICPNCGMPSDWVANGQHLLYITGGKPARIGVLEISSGKFGDRIDHPSYDLLGARGRLDSEGNGWVVFYANNGGQTRQIFLAPMHRFQPSPQLEWIPVTDGAHWDQSPAWAPDGSAVFYVNRDAGHASIMGRRIDPASGKPKGLSWTVFSFREPRQNLTAYTGRRGSDTLWVGGNRIYFVMESVKSDLWKISMLGPGK